MDIIVHIWIIFNRWSIFYTDTIMTVTGRLVVQWLYIHRCGKPWRRKMSPLIPWSRNSAWAAIPFTVCDIIWEYPPSWLTTYAGVSSAGWRIFSSISLTLIKNKRHSPIDLGGCRCFLRGRLFLPCPAVMIADSLQYSRSRPVCI